MIDPKTSAKKKKVSPMDKVTFLATAGSFLRTVWVVNTFTGRNHDSQMFGNIGDALLVKIPQIVWLSGVLYLVLVWKMLLVQSETMSKGNKDSIVKLEKSVGKATFALFIFMMPLYLLGNAGFPQLLGLADLILIFAAIFLVFKGLFFATKLTKALGGETADESRKTLIKTITKTVYVMSISCLSGTALSVYLLFVFDRTQKDANVTLTMIFWFYFHFICEGGICYSM
ncbi:hypothetical protein TrRE_jg11652, partial [Triparma retinervis]